MGASWKSLLAGFLAGVVNYFVSLGPNLPTTPEDWGHVALSAALVAFGAVVKDWNVSNAPKPSAATVVSAKSEARPNPAAAKP